MFHKQRLWMGRFIDLFVVVLRMIVVGCFGGAGWGGGIRHLLAVGVCLLPIDANRVVNGSSILGDTSSCHILNWLKRFCFIDQSVFPSVCLSVRLSICLHGATADVLLLPSLSLVLTISHRLWCLPHFRYIMTTFKCIANFPLQRISLAAILKFIRNMISWKCIPLCKNEKLFKSYFSLTPTQLIFCWLHPSHSRYTPPPKANDLTVSEDYRTICFLLYDTSQYFYILFK